MNTDPNRGIDETKAFVFDVLVGIGGLLGVGYAGYEMGIFTEVADTFPSIAIFGGMLLGASSVAIMESNHFRTLFERPIAGVVSATAMMCVVAGIVWAVSQTGPSRAMYTVLGVIAAALVTRICVFASRRTRSEGPLSE
jgi:hypothetical protein